MIAPWAHDYISENLVDTLIDRVYPEVGSSIDGFSRQYLSERAILAIANKDIARINGEI